MKRSVVVVGLAAVLAAACGTKSGPAVPAGPANYVGENRAIHAAEGRIGYLPLSEASVLMEQLQFSLRRGISMDREPYQPLIEAVNDRLAQHPALKALDPASLEFGASPPDLRWSGPRVTFGVSCDAGSAGSSARNVRSGETELVIVGGRRNDDRDPRRFLTQPANAEWRARVRDAAEAADVDYILLFAVGPSYYVTTGPTIGRRRLEMGTDYSISLPPVVQRNKCWGVLHITAALVDRDGQLVRAGAEGIIAGGGVAIAAALADLIPEVSVEEIRDRATTEVREDLAEQPPVWQTAVDHLLRRVAGLNGGP